MRPPKFEMESQTVFFATVCVDVPFLKRKDFIFRHMDEIIRYFFVIVREGGRSVLYIMTGDGPAPGTMT
jgi:hypothetical protein